MKLLAHHPGPALIAALAALVAWWIRPALANEPRVVVVTEAGIEAYDEALRGLERGLKNPPRVVAPDKAALESALSPPPSLVVTLGSGALAAAADSHTAAPLLSSMALDEAVRRARVPLAGSVSLDISLPRIMEEIAALFPGKTRLAVICGRQHPCGETPPAGVFTVQSIECATAEDVLRLFGSLRGKADFVIALPDSTLYNSATIKPLILASLANRLPLVGFSAAFVRSGAALGVYADFEDVGEQTAQLAQRILSGQAPPVHDGPRKRIAAVNQRVLRLLGLDYKQQEGLVVYK